MTGLGGTGRLLRLALRRDRVWLPIWLLVGAGIPAVFVAAFTGAFPTQAALDEYAQTSVHNSAFAVSYGLLYGSSLGQLVTWRAGFVPVVVALVSLLMVLRHTRVEEEAGRQELLAAAPIGRHAGLAAALLEGIAANVALGLLTTVGLVGSGLGVAGSLAHGLGVTGVGCTFAALGGLIAQLTTSAGAARTIGVVIVGAAFVLRGIGDVGAQTGGAVGWLAWLSPLAWGQLTRPFAGERFWTLLLPALAVGLCWLLAVRLAERRDLGSGLIQPRSGPATAPPSLRSALGLAWRLHRGPLVGRVVGVAVVSLALGGIAESIGQLMLHSTPAAREALARVGGPGAVIDQYFVSMVSILGIVVAGFAIDSVLRLRVEEDQGHAELLLSTPVTRSRWAAGHLALAGLSSTLAVSVAGVGLAVGYGLTTRETGPAAAELFAAVVVQLPAVWLFAGLAFALFGCLPRWPIGAYVVLGGTLLISWVGGELQLSSWVMGFSVFHHLPQLPGGVFTVTPILVLLIGALGLAGLGLVGVRRRDIAAG
jgi:ABC-2 type transport system permease protein